MSNQIAQEQLIDSAIDKIEHCLYYSHGYAIPGTELPRLKNTLLEGERFSIEGRMKLEAYPYLCNMIAWINNRFFPSWLYVEIVAKVDKNVKANYSFCLLDK